MGDMTIRNHKLPVEPIQSGYSKEKGETTELPSTIGAPTILTTGQNIGDCTEAGVQGQDLSQRAVKEGGYTPKGANILLSQIPK
ncbi:MAG: hypothetical protein KR126chlam4_00892 [Candidatus Anoxychlamydiales bacterium]|nr:hypothetical protein [Candidatus Anoxychlamydiales bacterium]NGX41057.1 hypothetical protein [Candidatus Anoxychlamydiales bacterium]HEU64826.1 hypothetical protein [Chlamydiota bacterium]